MSVLRVNKIAAPIIEEEYTGSVHLDAGYDKLIVNGLADFDGQFTIEGWYLASAFETTPTYFGNWDTATGILLRGTTSLTLFEGGDSSILTVSNANVNETGRWYHIAVTRDGTNTIRLFKDGVVIGSVVHSDTIDNQTRKFTIGAEKPGTSGSDVWNGHISNFRIVQGNALYTDNFEVPTRELEVVDGTVVLCCQSSTSVTEEASGETTITIDTEGGNPTAQEANPGLLRKTNIYSTTSENTGSVFFDGTDDILNLPSTSEFNFGTDNFTIEFWIYPTATQPNYAGIIVQGSDSNPSWFVHYDNGSPAKLRLTSWDTNILVSTNTPTLNVWTHYAMVREGTGSDEFKMYVNGTLDVTGTYADELGQTTTTHIAGGYSGGSRPKFQGYISNLRIVKGRAIYTSNFAVPTRELEVVDGTVLLCCHDGEDIFADKSEKHVIAAIGDRLSSPTPTATDSPIGITTFQPGLTRSVDPTAGPVLQGNLEYNSQNFLVLPKGTTTDRNRTGGRGIFGAGFDGSSNVNTISFVTISSTGNASDFGDLTQARYGPGSCSSSTKGVFGGGFTSSNQNTIDYIAIPSTGDAVDFGDLTVSRRAPAGASNSTRGLFAGGSSPGLSNTIDFITFPTLGDAIDFGNLTSARTNIGGCSSPTRGIFAGGAAPAGQNIIEFVTIATTGDATDFGDLSTAINGLSAVSSNTRGVFAGGNPTSINLIEYITISTLGDATDFGDLTLDRRQLSSSGASNSIRGVFAGGRQSPSPGTNTNLMDYITIASTGDAKDFGDLIAKTRLLTGCSDSHGGIS